MNNKNTREMKTWPPGTAMGLSHILTPPPKCGSVFPQEAMPTPITAPDPIMCHPQHALHHPPIVAPQGWDNLVSASSRVQKPSESADYLKTADSGIKETEAVIRAQPLGYEFWENNI